MKKKSTSDYFEKLSDPRWQRKRLEIFERDNYTCTVCGETTKMLHVHHKYYVSRRDPWAYPNEALTTLCKDCHTYESTDGDNYNPNSPREWELIVSIFLADGDGPGFGVAADVGTFQHLNSIKPKMMLEALSRCLRSPSESLSEIINDLKDKEIVSK